MFMYSYCYVMYSYCYVYIFLFLCLYILIVRYVPFLVFSFIVLFCVLFVCKCVLFYCHRVSTQLQSPNISYHIFVMSKALPSKFRLPSDNEHSKAHHRVCSDQQLAAIPTAVPLHLTLLSLYTYLKKCGTNSLFGVPPVPTERCAAACGVPSLRQFVSLGRATVDGIECGALVKWYWQGRAVVLTVRGIGAMVLTGDSRSTGSQGHWCDGNDRGQP